MIRTIETLSKKMIERWQEKAEEEGQIDALRWMCLAHKLKNNRQLTVDDIIRCLDFLKENDGHPKMVEMFKICLEEGTICKKKI